MYKQPSTESTKIGNWNKPHKNDKDNSSGLVPSWYEKRAHTWKRGGRSCWTKSSPGSFVTFVFHQLFRVGLLSYGVIDQSPGEITDCRVINRVSDGHSKLPFRFRFRIGVSFFWDVTCQVRISFRKPGILHCESAFLWRIFCGLVHVSAVLSFERTASEVRHYLLRSLTIIWT